MRGDTAGRSAPPSAAVREFNRFYTGVLGLLRGSYLETPYSLTEARVIFEIAQRAGTDATELRRVLDLDAGYLSRILARLSAEGLISRERSQTDARRQMIILTAAGRAAFETLDERAEAQARDLLAGYGAEDQQRLAGAMAVIRRIMSGGHAKQRSVVLRAPLPGELGWVVQRHGAVYAAEYGWDESFEALVARIVADYAGSHGARGEAAWIAELDGQPAGCVFCVRVSDTAAQLRLLLVEPPARGMGIGGRLVAECINFANRAGYRELVLWTNDVLVQARRIYEKAGFQLIESQPHHSFGHDLVAQTWRLALG